MVRTRQFPLALALITTLIFAVSSSATPVRPDLHKLLRQNHPRTFAPAHAGWNGPEMQPQQTALNPTLEAYGPAATARAMRAGLRAAVIPDPKAVLAIGILILLMRIQRVQQQRKRQAQVIAIDALTEKERLAA